MSRIVSVRPTLKGIDFTRMAMAAAMGPEARDIAVKRWGEQSLAVRVANAGGVEQLAFNKAAVAAGSTVSGNWAELLADEETAVTEFFEAVRERSIIGRIAGWRNVPLRTRLVCANSGFTAAWIGEAEPVSLSASAFTEDNLPSRKVSALTVVTDEMLDSADPQVELLIRNDLAGAVAAAVDQTLLDPTNAGVAGVMPASLSNGITATTASGTSSAQTVRNLIADFPSDLSRAVLIASPVTLANLYDANQLPNIGVRGGNAIGIPAFASEQAGDYLTLIDPDGIAMGAGTTDLRTSREATIEMLDSSLVQDPSTGTGTAMVSLFQINAAAIMATQFVNWEVVRPSVSYADVGAAS
ncbi:phage major capsid protein [Croceicoccus sp. Ery5]|uniref:phage major capsid protein n=1 Tax=Croceicoccus sp. Ery5 TaxID=1703340 RepID=UPI001E2ADE19|nr:phage major capsid protein [Croceicoccus sp. Ery5]